MGKRDSRVDQLQTEQIDELKKVTCSEFESFDIWRLLFTQSYVSVSKNKLILVVTVIISLFFKREVITKDVKKNPILLYSETRKNKDHMDYWRSIEKLFQNRDVIWIDKLNIKRWNSFFSPAAASRKIRKMIRFAKELHCIKNWVRRVYLASQLTWLHEFYVELDQMSLSPAVAMCFYDGGFHEALMVQYFKLKGIVTMTHQHGQPVFKSLYEDYVSQGQILCFNSDYYIAKGQFALDQFYKAGIDLDRIKVLGGFEPVNQKLVNMHNNMFAVFLDCPDYSWAYQSNITLLRLADEISKLLKYNYIVKIHPLETKNRYKKYIGVQGTFWVDGEFDNLMNNIDFAIFFASGIYIDLLKYNVKGYQFYSSWNPLPIVTNKGDLFTDINDFWQKYSLWIKKPLSEKIEYLSETRKYYYISSEFPQNYIQFVNSFISTEIKNDRRMYDENSGGSSN